MPLVLISQPDSLGVEDPSVSSLNALKPSLSDLNYRLINVTTGEDATFFI